MEIGIIILTLILVSLFSSVEIAFVSFGKFFLRSNTLEAGFSPKILTKFIENPAKFTALNC